MTSKRLTGCCEAINNSIGIYYENRAKITALRSIELEDKFRYCPDQLATRSGFVFAFLTDLTVAILAKFASLSDPSLCKNPCCASAAVAIQQIGDAYATDIFTVVSSPVFSNQALIGVIIPGLVVGYTNALNAVVLQSNCDNQCDSSCGCKTKTRK